MTQPEEYRICARCVMDTSDHEITFDDEGVCNHCREFDEVISKRWFQGDDGARRLKVIVERIKAEGRSREYDCIIGLSGGIDSSYLALMIKEFGLRPLVVHVDAGWNSELAVYNIERIVKYCGWDLHTLVMDWEEVRDLQLSFLKAGVANQDVIQDHAFFSSLYHFAIKSKIKYIISGGNIATESIFPAAWHHSAMDARSIHDIQRRFGSIRLDNFKTISILQYYFIYPFVYGMKTIRPLNYLDYNKDKALAFLVETIGFKEYGRKHGESIFTRFFQNYFLPAKFGYDKRRPHLSSLILSAQMSRAEALIELRRPLYDEKEVMEDMAYIAKKLQISDDELKSYVDSERRSYALYKNWDSAYAFIKRMQRTLARIRKKSINNYA